MRYEFSKDMFVPVNMELLLLLYVLDDYYWFMFLREIIAAVIALNFTV